jgi:serine/threonine protein kinase
MEDNELVCPSKIGPYQLRGTIGTGGYATVKLAFRPDQQRFYACKIIRRKRLKTERELAIFEAEIRILQQLHNPHLVAICDVFKDSLNYYLLMEFCPNGDLFALICKIRRIPEDHARVIIKQILLALEYIHRLDIGHRDIKPENIMIDGSGNARLTDFGLAKYAPDGALTSTGCGSPIYVSPEILSGVPYSPQMSDMWSIGVVLYALVSGQLPWTSTNRQHVFNQIQSASFSIPTTVSQPCSDLIKRLMVAKPAHRLTAKEALEHEWIQACVELPLSEPPPTMLSIRRVDAFFAQDTDEPDIPHALVKKSCSSSSLSSTWAKALNAITVNQSVARPKPVVMAPVPVCPSMVVFGNHTVEMEGPESTFTADIHSLMQGFSHMQRKKGPKIVKPRIQKGKVCDLGT